MRKYMVAVVQMDTQNDKEANWAQIADYIDEAAEKGVTYSQLPSKLKNIYRQYR